MPNTYSKIYLHFVFAVKGRENLILDEWEGLLFKYIAGIVERKKQKLFVINGYKDHLHLLISINADCVISDLMRDVKNSSSRWINENKLVKGKFSWQTGFSAFSVSESQLKKTINYIENQKNHHQKVSFKNEYISLLNAYNIDFKEEYLLEGSATPTE